MAYKYSEARKHILTPELVIHDMKDDDRFGKAAAPFMLVFPPIVALIVTFFMRLVTGGEGAEFVVGIIVSVLFWLAALMIMAVAVFILANRSKPMRPEDIHIVKRRLDTISYNERQRTSGRHSVERDVFYFEGMDKYFPSPTQVALAKEGDEYYIVTAVEGGIHPIRIYRADAYIWNG